MEKVENQLSIKWKNDLKERIEYLEKLKRFEATRSTRENNRQSRASSSLIDV
jgi:hypothetical protein